MKLFLIGGFLGSGKTTAIINACKHLQANDQRVAVITNDQGEQQVDSALIKSIGIPAAEVSNGCFCCNYHELDKHIHSFINNTRPNVIFAESVGSCTDLVATVAKPFANAMPDCTVVISVFAEASLLSALLEARASFIKENVRYIYKKQLEDADLLVINKTDLVSAQQLDTITKTLIAEFPAKIILHQNSLNENDIQNWIKTQSEFQKAANRMSLEIDYDLYGDGEAQLAWLDKSIMIITAQPNAVMIVNEIISMIYNNIQEQGLVIGHLKFLIETGDSKNKISITTASELPDLLQEDGKSCQARLLINARVQTEPEVLLGLVNNVLRKFYRRRDCNISVESWSSFKPGYPKPTHRIA